MNGDEIGVVAALGVLVLMIIVGLLRKVRWCAPLSCAQSAAASVASYFGSWKQGKTDEIGLMVRAKMQQLQVDNLRWACQVLCLALFPIALHIIFATMSGRFRVLMFWQIVAYIIKEGTLALVLLFPSVVSSRTIDVVYSVVLLSTSLLASPLLCESETFVMVLLCSNFAVSFMNVMRRAAPIVIPMNLMVSVSFCSTIVHNWFADYPAQSLMLAMAQFLILVACPGLIHMLDMGMAAIIRQGFEMHAAQEALGAASALLRSCCDVVVELDSDGVVETEGLELGSFLLRGTGYNLQGTQLSELFWTEADKAMFQGKLKEPKPSGVGVAEAIHVRVRDGNNQLLRIELLVFQFRHLDDQPHFMVGIREFTDVPAKGVAPSSTQELQEEGEAGGAEGAGRPDLWAASFSHTSSASAFGEDDPESESPAVLAVDSHCLGLHIRECSQGFRHRVGRLPLGTCFAPLVRRSEDFQLWLQLGVNSAMYGEDGPPCNITINMRQGPVKAQCKLLRTARSGEEEAFNPEHVRLQLFNIRQCSNNVSCNGSETGSQMHLKGTPVVHASL